MITERKKAMILLNASAGTGRAGLNTWAIIKKLAENGYESIVYPIIPGTDLVSERLVTEYEGTTRDTIEEYISIDGVPLKIIDTAGIRNSEDRVEKIGVEKAIKIAEYSDIVIAIFDISKKLNEEDFEILNLIKNKKSIIVLNKNDLENKINIEKIKEVNKPIVEISTKTRDGIDKLYKEISNIFKLNEIASNGELIISNNRHKSLIINARKNLQKSRETIVNNMPIDIISTYLKDILEELGKITGQTVTEEVINEIFAKFCLGK